MYKDAMFKIDFYKSQIMQELTKRGIYPDEITVQTRINNINERLSIFRYMEVSPQLNFDTEKMNTDMAYIWQDLYFLYKIVYELAVKEYIDIKSYADCHLAELENLARKYRYKTELEINSTALGKTIFFQTSGYTILYKDNRAIISLGAISTIQGSRLACIFEADNIATDKVVFSFDGQNCSPYSYNKDFFKVPGEIQSKLFSYSLPEDLIINTSFQLNIDDFNPSLNSRYIIFAGENTITVYDSDKNQAFLKKQQKSSYLIKTPGRIEFCVYNGSYINFDFLKEPVSKNFTENTVVNLEKRHKIIIECEKDFVFDFITDGQVFAVQENGIVNDNKLYYPTSIQLCDFLIEEFSPGESVNYNNVDIVINNIDINPININLIAIKELVPLEMWV